MNENADVCASAEEVCPLSDFRTWLKVPVRKLFLEYSEEIEKQKAHERYMKLPEQEKTKQARKDLVAGTSYRPRTFRQEEVEHAEKEKAKSQSEEESDKEPELKRKRTQGIIEIRNPNLVKQKNVKARDIDIEKTIELFRREREEIENQKAHERNMKLLEQKKTKQARKDLGRSHEKMEQADHMKEEIIGPQNEIHDKSKFLEGRLHEMIEILRNEVQNTKQQNKVLEDRLSDLAESTKGELRKRDEEKADYVDKCNNIIIEKDYVMEKLGAQKLELEKLQREYNLKEKENADLQSKINEYARRGREVEDYFKKALDEWNSKYGTNKEK